MKLYLQCPEIMDRFCSKERLRECHHQMSSQKNSIMRYAPKEKTYCWAMALTWRINISVGIDCVGHAEYFERLFRAMKLRYTQRTFSGLRRMWRKKEYGVFRQEEREVATPSNSPNQNGGRRHQNGGGLEGGALLWKRYTTRRKWWRGCWDTNQKDEKTQQSTYQDTRWMQMRSPRPPAGLVKEVPLERM